MPGPVTITKVGDTAPVPAHTPIPPLPAAAARPRKPRTMKTFPKGILKKTAKIKPVRDPAKPPPTRKDVRKHSVRVLTEKGAERRRRTIRQKVKSMKDDEVRAALQKAGVAQNPKTPPHVLRDMLEGGVESGMISPP
jgi:hypothetical protein